MTTYGSKYDGNMDTREICKLVRNEVRLNKTLGTLPDGRWSVTMERYSQGSSITIEYQPPVELDEAFAQAYFNRDRIVFEAESPKDHPTLPRLSVFGLALEARLEAILAQYNRTCTDSTNVKFHGSVRIAPRAGFSTLLDLYRGGCLPERTLSQLNAGWDVLLRVWEAEAKSEASVQEVEKALEGEKVLVLPARPPERHLRLVRDEPAFSEELSDFSALLQANDQARPAARARRRPIAVPVVEPVPETPNEAWARLALAQVLKLDFRIPGLVIP